jgi:glycosyltransferase involved in cell wall biosynthesis
LENNVYLTGGLNPGEARLIGLFQLAKALLLPSLNETFGLVILEAWAAKTPVIASHTAGSMDLVQPGVNGWLFDLDDPAEFHTAVKLTLNDSAMARRLGRAGRQLVKTAYNSADLAAKTGDLYRELIGERS